MFDEYVTIFFKSIGVLKVPTKKDNNTALLISIPIIAIFLYLGFSNNTISSNDLQLIRVTLSDTPRYHIYKIKSTTYREIHFTTLEYKNPFAITSFTFNASNHDFIKSNLSQGDTIHFSISKSDLADLNSFQYASRDIEVFGLTKMGTSMINLELRNRLARNDSKWAFFFVVFGIVILPYGFIRKKPLIDLPYAIIITAALELIIMLIILKK